jgi:maltooligosyltrehalose trehalohydrolase
VHLRCWAPEHQRVEVVLFDRAARELERVAMQRADGFFEARVPWRSPFLYKLAVDGEGPFPDPWSRAQPLGVHGPSSIDQPDFAWSDGDWKGVPLEELVLYELHVGTATPEGTFEALIPKLGTLKELGVTALELMPVASAPGARNWGYDGVFPFAPAEIYGGPRGLRRLVDAAHRAGLAVLLDAVYNHLGPDGNYLRCFSRRYFTGEVHTPWGEAVNFDGKGCQPVREFALANAEMWIRDYHLDGLRLDATHEIVDRSTPHLLAELVERARAAGSDRQVIVIAENDRNDPNLVRPAARGGLGLDGVWADDFHHELRRAFAGDSEGYFQDYRGTTQELAETLNEGWFYRGQFSPNQGRPRGESARDVEPPRFVYCIQNHDQIGNRPLGTRLGQDVSPAAFRAMSALLLCAPHTPLLFMGQEWNARTPFLYFTDHEPELGKKVTEGRRSEFKAFSGFHHVEVPDPQAVETFTRSKLDWNERLAEPHRGIWRLYAELLRLRREHPAMRKVARGSFEARALDEEALELDRTGDGKGLRLVVQLDGAREVSLAGARVLVHTEDARFGGAGVPLREGAVRLTGPCAVLLELG